MKLLISWAISFSLSLQPALVWAGTKTVSHRNEINNEIKSYLKKTGLTRKAMSVQEFYNNNKDLFDDEERASLEQMVKENGSVQIPKFDVTTVKNKSGEDVYQLQAVADGQSTSITLYGDQDEFARVNGVSISVKEGVSIEKTMTKLGAPKEAMDYYFRGPASVSTKAGKMRKPSNAGKILSAEQVMKMNLEQKQKYFQQLRQLMESVESVQNAFDTTPHGANLQTEMWQYFATLFVGENVFAEAKSRSGGAGSPPVTAEEDASQGTVANDKACVIAGNISSQGVRPKVKKQTCGRDDKGELLSGLACAENNNHQVLVQCNRVLYGDDAPCISAGPTSTQLCNEKLKDKPLKFDNYAAYSAFKTGADAVIESAKSACGENFDGSGTVRNFKPNMNTDQKNACKALSVRVATINGLCPADSKNAWCKATTETTPATGQPTAGAPADNADKKPKCSDLKTQKGYIENGSVEKCALEDSSMRIDDKECIADDNVHIAKVQMCVCVGGYHESTTSSKFKCIKGDSSSTASTGGDNDTKKKGFWSKTKGVFSKIGGWFGDHKNFFAKLTVGLLVTGVVYKIAKKSTKAYYENLDPVTPVAPITVPTVPPSREGAY